MQIWVEINLVDYYLDDLVNYLEAEDYKIDTRFNLHVFPIEKLGCMVYKSIHSTERFDFNESEYMKFSSESEFLQFVHKKKEAQEQRNHIDHILSKD